MRLTIFFLLVASGYWLVPAPAAAQFNSFTRQELTLELTPVPDVSAAKTGTDGAVGGGNLSSYAPGGANIPTIESGSKKPCTTSASYNGYPLAEGNLFQEIVNIQTGTRYPYSNDMSSLPEGAYKVLAWKLDKTSEKYDENYAFQPLVVEGKDAEKNKKYQEMAANLYSISQGTDTTTTNPCDGIKEKLQQLNQEIEDLIRRLVAMGYDPSNPDEPYSDYATTLANQLQQKEQEERNLKQRCPESTSSTTTTPPTATTPSSGSSGSGGGSGSFFSFTVTDSNGQLVPAGTQVAIGALTATANSSGMVSFQVTPAQLQANASATPVVITPEGTSIAASLTAEVPASSSTTGTKPLIFTTEKSLTGQTVSYQLLLQLISQSQDFEVPEAVLTSFFSRFFAAAKLTGEQIWYYLSFGFLF